MNNLRKIALIADIHGLLEPLEAVLDDCRRNGITEIYSLGDAIGFGPDSSSVLDLLKDRNVRCIAGNAEDYMTLGISTFKNIFNFQRLLTEAWIEKQISVEQKLEIQNWPHSLDLTLGGKNIALCHFANDIRFDYLENGVLFYYENYKDGQGAQQFFYTNSDEQKAMMNYLLNVLSDNEKKGYLSAIISPLFGGKTVDYYDAIFQGHVHFKVMEYYKNRLFMAVRAAGMAFLDDPLNQAYYAVLTEKDAGFGITEEYVDFDREQMEWKINHSDCPDARVRKFTSMR